ncbi:MAG TPA: type IV toxin-antitoxin system AbiEi family antitoxin domain-containing protein [Thermoleophilaceae bacterium]
MAIDPPEQVECRLTRARVELFDTRPDRAVAWRAARQFGIVSMSDLREFGLSHDAVRWRVRKGWLHPLYRGVYAVGHANPPLEGRFTAAVKACGDGVLLSHYSAAALWGFVHWDGRYPEVTVHGGTTRRHPALRVHRTTSLDQVDRSSHRGIPVTAPARTLADLACQLDYRALRRAVRQAQSLRRVSLRELVAVTNRLGRRRGTVNLMRILATGPAPTRSELEDVILDLIVSAGVRRPEVNVPLHLLGRRVVPDFRWPGCQLVVEADGAAWHDHRLAREDDAERQALLEAHGEHVLRVTWRQAISQPRQTIARIRAAGAPAD